MARTGDQDGVGGPGAANAAANAAQWDAIEAKYWRSLRMAREQEDGELAASFQAKQNEVISADIRLHQEHAAVCNEMSELRRRLRQLEDLAKEQQQAINKVAYDSTQLQREFDEQRVILQEERAREDEERRAMFVSYRACDVTEFRPEEPRPGPERQLSAAPSPSQLPESRSAAGLEPNEAATSNAQHNGQHEAPTPPATWPDEVRYTDHHGAQPLQTRPGSQLVLQPKAPDGGQAPAAKAQFGPQPSARPDADMGLAPIHDAPREGDGEAGDALITPESRRPSSEATSRLSTPPSEPMMDDIDLVSLTRGLQPIGAVNEKSVKPSAPTSPKEPAESAQSTGGFKAVNASSVRPSLGGPGQGAGEGNNEAEMTTDGKPKVKKKKNVKTVQPYKRSAPHTPVGSDNEGQAPALPEINKSVLSLRDNGVVFTDPPAMRGVPLAKIRKGDRYWEADWTDLETTISETLRKWETKYEETVAANGTNSTKFLANRQVNRGKAVLKFLEEGELHPFQIMGKAYIKKQLSNYDKLFRMTQILEELTKFKIDVTPSQWLRHRLCEVLEEVGPDEFDLAQTVSDLYHDPKVLAIRSKSGFGNIGRPPGWKPADGSKKGTRGERAKKGKGDVRTSPNQAGAPAQPGAIADAPAPASPPRPPGRPTAPQPSAGATSPEKARSKGTKKARVNINPTQIAAEDSDLHYDGYTTTDSFSMDPICADDWRLYQIKHAREQTDPHVTQYWHWLEGDKTFEHQVLSDLSPKWGIYKDPHYFHLRFAEITEITMAADSNKIIVGTRPLEEDSKEKDKEVRFRGELLVGFKRDRTKRRFIRFLGQKGIKVVKTTEAYIEDAWTKMEPSFSLADQGA